MFYVIIFILWWSLNVKYVMVLIVFSKVKIKFKCCKANNDTVELVFGYG